MTIRTGASLHLSEPLESDSRGTYDLFPNRKIIKGERTKRTKPKEKPRQIWMSYRKPVINKSNFFPSPISFIKGKSATKGAFFCHERELQTTKGFPIHGFRPSPPASTKPFLDMSPIPALRESPFSMSLFSHLLELD